MGYIKGFIKSFFKDNYSILSFVNSNCQISDKATVYRGSRISGVILGDYSYLGKKTVAHNLTVGKYCSIADFCTFGMPEHSIKTISTSPVFNSVHNGTRFSFTEKNTFHTEMKVEIGNDVWIGYGVMVVKNVKIGNGAIVAAGAVVTKDVPPYAIVGGVPAKVIKYRFSEDVVNKLQSIKWWDLPDYLIRKNIELFQKEDLTVEDLKVLGK